jgi:aspartate/methionine/tyrosine aminotransferase
MPRLPEDTTGASVFAALQGAIDARSRAGLATVPLHIGDTYVDPPPCARLDALVDMPEREAYVYGATIGLGALREAFASRQVRRHGVAYDPGAEVHVGVGGTHALFCAVRALLAPGDQVVVVTPCWPLVRGVLRTAGVVPVEAPLYRSVDEATALDRDDADAEAHVRACLAAAVTPNTRAIYFASPNNPDGRVWGPRAMRALLEIACQHDLWVFSDEVYADWYYEGTHVAFATLSGARARTLTIASLSKSHALAGYRIGFVTGPAEAIAHVRRASVHSAFNVPVVLQRTAALALEHGDAWQADVRAAYNRARQASGRALAGVPVVACRAATYHFVDCRPYLAAAGVDTETILLRALERGVLVTPGGASGAHFDGWVRVCFTAAPLEVVERGASLLRAALEG